MKAFYKAVIKDLQKKLLGEGTLLRALTCVNLLEQKAADSLQHCSLDASHMQDIQPGDEI